MIWLNNYTSSFGLSDHSLVEKDKNIATKAAIFLGADVIERHFTILDSNKTKDGPVSITPDLLKDISSFTNLSKQQQEQELKNLMPNWSEVI